MSWHTNAILIKADLSKDHSVLFKQLGLNGGKPGSTVVFEEATSAFLEGVAVGCVEGWTALWGNMALMFVEPEDMGTVAKKADVFTMLLEGASSTASFSWYHGGKLIRHWMRQEGNTVEDVGKPLPQEEQAFKTGNDEDAVLQMLESLTLSLEKLQAIQYQVYQFPEDAMFGLPD